MLLVQNVTDEVKADRAMIEKATKAFLRSGGRIEKVGARLSADTSEFNGVRRKEKTGKQAAAGLDARIHAALPGLIKLHRAGTPVSIMAKEQRTTVPTIKRHLFKAGEDPHANIKNYPVSYSQLLVIQSMTAGDATAADIAAWAGLPVESVRTIIRDFKFKR